MASKNARVNGCPLCGASWVVMVHDGVISLASDDQCGVTYLDSTPTRCPYCLGVVRVDEARTTVSLVVEPFGRE